MTHSPQNNNKKTRRRAITLALVPIVIAFGFACKFYRGPGSDWVNNWGPASAAYEWLWMLLVFALIPKRSFIVRIAVGVFVATCAVEFLQLWQPAWLQQVRSTLPGRFVLGTTFSWWDFPAYVVGSVTGALGLLTICRTTEPTSTENDF